MSRILPILFNTDMVRAILDGEKTVTRRVIKSPYYVQGDENDKNTLISVRTAPRGSKLYRQIGEMPYPDSPYNITNVLYVRETWNWNPLNEYGTEENKYIYKAGYDGHAGEVGWRPSIHMPKEAAHIWLKVTDVRVERLQDITEEQAVKEGFQAGSFKYEGAVWGQEDTDEWTAKEEFAELWNTTIKKSDLERYGWKGNPWVWVIEFERCEKPDIQLKRKSVRKDIEMIIIGGKEFEVGQRIRVISAKSVLHYDYGITGDENGDMKGITGVITAKSTYCEEVRAILKVDEPYQDRYKNGMTRLFCDDEVELLDK